MLSFDLSPNFVVQDGEFDAVAIVHSYEEGRPVGSHKTRLSALNVIHRLENIIIIKVSFPVHVHMHIGPL